MAWYNSGNWGPSDTSSVDIYTGVRHLIHQCCYTINEMQRALGWGTKTEECGWKDAYDEGVARGYAGAGPTGEPLTTWLIGDGTYKALPAVDDFLSPDEVDVSTEADMLKGNINLLVSTNILRMQSAIDTMISSGHIQSQVVSGVAFDTAYTSRFTNSSGTVYTDSATLRTAIGAGATWLELGRRNEWYLVFQQIQSVLDAMKYISYRVLAYAAYSGYDGKTNNSQFSRGYETTVYDPPLYRDDTEDYDIYWADLQSDWTAAAAVGLESPNYTGSDTAVFVNGYVHITFSGSTLELFNVYAEAYVVCHIVWATKRVKGTLIATPSVNYAMSHSSGKDWPPNTDGGLDLAIPVASLSGIEIDIPASEDAYNTSSTVSLTLFPEPDGTNFSDKLYYNNTSWPFQEDFIGRGSEMQFGFSMDNYVDLRCNIATYLTYVD